MICRNGNIRKSAKIWKRKFIDIQKRKSAEIQKYKYGNVLRQNRQNFFLKNGSIFLIEIVSFFPALRSRSTWKHMYKQSHQNIFTCKYIKLCGFLSFDKLPLTPPWYYKQPLRSQGLIQGEANFIHPPSISQLK